MNSIPSNEKTATILTDRHVDTEIERLIQKELQRHRETIQLIAAENITRNSTLAPLASILVSKTAEGVPGNRYHSGCSVVDELELMAEQRACQLYHAKRAWLQPLSGSMANLIVMVSLFRDYLRTPEDVRILSMGLDQGGHLSHGSRAHITGQLFPNLQYYTVDSRSGLLDYDAIEKTALSYQPRLLICGASSYPRTIDFKRFGDIAKRCGAILLADIAHINGLVTAGVHPSPIPYAHFVTCSTYKAGGPKGGVILAGDLATEDQCKSLSKAVFPGVQSTPDFASIAAKAAFFAECMTDEYRATQKLIVDNASALANALADKGFEIATGGTDNHIILVNVKKSVGLTGKEANTRLERCGLNVNKNVLPFDEEKATVGSGIRIGTNTVSRLGMGVVEMRRIADFFEEILKADLTDEYVANMKSRVKDFMSNYSIDAFLAG